MCRNTSSEAVLNIDYSLQLTKVEKVFFLIFMSSYAEMSF
jgi:hypothetical protein